MSNNNKRIIGQIQEWANKMIDGDINAYNEIINYYTDFIIKTVEKKYDSINYDKAKLIEAGVAALIKGTKRYNKSYNSTFSTYIINYVNSKIIKERNRQENKDRGKIQQWANEMTSGDTEARKNLIEHYTCFIVQFIEKNYNDQNYSKEDLIQAGIVGLLNAIKCYTQDYKTPFSTYICSRIYESIFMELKNQNENLDINYIGLNNNHKNDTDIDFFDDFEDIELIEKGIEDLPKKYKEILHLHIYENYILADIAKMYNISTQRVGQIYKKSIKMIKEKMNEEKITHNDKIKIKKRI